MTIKKATYILVFLLLLGVAHFAYAASDDTRYFVKSTSGWWRKSFGVRNSFDGGFTSDLSDWQLKIARIFGVEVEPVRKFNILPAQADLLAQPVLPIASQTKTSGVKTNLFARPVPAQNVPWGVKAVYGSSLIEKTIGGQGVNVVVLDTGVLKTHPDLKSRIKDCKDFTNPKSAVVDGKCEDKNGHGTHVSGIIAADGGSDGLGIYGIAPEASIWAYKVCSNNGTCWADDIAGALRTAADNGANIANLSLGSDLPSQLITDAVAYVIGKSVLVVAAAGNDGPDQGSIDYPAANPDVVAVGALDSSLQIPDWSSRGINSLTKPYEIEEKDMEFAAPGVNIESTWKDGGYDIISGTSMASPHVAGLAAKLWQKDALNPAAATRDILHKLSNDLPPLGDDDSSGWGMPRL